MPLTDVLPWFLPGLAITAVVALALADRVALRLRTHRRTAFLLIMSVGAVLAATIPPDSDGFSGHSSAAGRCDFERLGPAPFVHYLHVGDSALNVILFVPLGLAVGLLGRSSARTWVLVAATALPAAIEILQSLAPVLGRGCQSHDVIDNLVGLGLGLAAGALLSADRVCRRKS